MSDVSPITTPGNPLRPGTQGIPRDGTWVLADLTSRPTEQSVIQLDGSFDPPRWYDNRNRLVAESTIAGWCYREYELRLAKVAA